MNFTAQGSITFSEKPGGSAANPSIIKEATSSAFKQIIEGVIKLAILIIVVVGAFYSLRYTGHYQAAEKVKSAVDRRFPELSEFLQSPEIPNVNYYTVLIGSAPTEIQAHALAIGLREARIKYDVFQQNSKWFVCVGKYSNLSWANRTKQELLDRGFGDVTVPTPQ